jgi:hypothetical protein
MAVAKSAYNSSFKMLKCNIHRKNKLSKCVFNFNVFTPFYGINNKLILSRLVFLANANSRWIIEEMRDAVPSPKVFPPISYTR